MRFGPQFYLKSVGFQEIRDGWQSDPMGESTRAVRLAPRKGTLGESSLSSTALERLRVLRPVARVQPTSAYLDFLASI